MYLYPITMQTDERVGGRIKSFHTNSVYDFLVTITIGLYFEFVCFSFFDDDE